MTKPLDPNDAATERLVSDAAPKPTESLTLTVLGSTGSRSVSLPAAGTFVIGRGTETDFRIDDRSISRRHAILHLGSQLQIEDLESANGTRVSSVRVSPGQRADIAPGDLIEIGHVVCVVQARNVSRARANAATPPSSAGAEGDAMRELYRMAERIAAGSIHVLLLGETGVGKEILARRIHTASPRREGPYVALNCSAFSEALLESELFGHEKGAFTNAMTAKQGLLETASGGTVFLDEIGELPPSLQSKLLRVLEERMIRRVGALKPREIDVRFVAATNRDLEAEIAAGRFRSDLFFRLGAATLVIPPLRERVAEIATLAQRFLADASKAAGRHPVRLDADALALMQRYRWPGNVRELRNAMERALLLTSADVIAIEHLPATIRTGGKDARATGGLPDPSALPIAVITKGSDASNIGQPLDASLHDASLQAAVDTAERDRIVQALRESDGNQTAAAKRLGIARRTLINKIIAHGIPRPRGA